MRLIKALLALSLTALVVFLLNRQLGPLPPLGPVLDPVNGAMAAAEPGGASFSKKLKLKGLQQPVDIWFEDRLVPHLRAANDHDLYFSQGYLHAYFRLWQMDMQTRAAAGRVSEVAGKKSLAFDRGQRRKGMVYAAEQSLQAMERDPRTRGMLDAYRDGVNAFIGQCSFRELPLEYKLMDFRPEAWTNMRSALLLKYMADDLTGKTDDIAFTVLRRQLGDAQFDFLFPERIQGSTPVIPAGTRWEKPSLKRPAVPADPFAVVENMRAAAAHTNAGSSQWPYDNVRPPETAIGSNNWAVSGKHTASGAPILCNDPHLGLNLPSLWFEMQLTAPGNNVYGVSLPGAPGIVIGFNDSLSWGVTNNYRDVKDYYDVKVIDAAHYLFDGKARTFEKRVEVIRSKDSADLVDTMRYTFHGPVQYEPGYPDPEMTGKTLACTWMAHRGTNELLSLYLLNRAGNYDQYVAAIHHFECPAQNFVYADRAGNIAMWGQGRFINKWPGQGKFILRGDDRSTLWGDTIPMRENPHVLNPAQGYVASANQITTDSTYPYWYNGGGFADWRAWEINRYLAAMQAQGLPAVAERNGRVCLHCSDDDVIGYSQVMTGRARKQVSMKAMQNDNSSLAGGLFEAWIWSRAADSAFYRAQWPAALARDSTQAGGFAPALLLEPGSLRSAFYQLWMTLFTELSWANRWTAAIRPKSERSFELLYDTVRNGFDVPGTTAIETADTYLKQAFLQARDSLGKLLADGKSSWYKIKNTSLTHLAKIKAFSYEQLPIGGWSNTINAAASKWGPSWRMIVELGRDSIEAWAIYPGGPSGNPGSRYYGNLVSDWVQGNYRRLLFIPTGTQNPDRRIRHSWKLEP